MKFIDWIKDWKTIVFGLMVWLIAIAVSTIVLLSGCKTYEPIWVKELPPTCNMTLNTYRLYYDSNDKSATVPSSEACNKLMVKLMCQEMHFGLDANGKLNPVDYGNSEKYRAYEQCRSELK